MTIRLPVLVFVCLLSVATPVSAAGLYFLSGTPMSKFTDDDKRIFREAAIEALENAADGARSEWGNPATDAGGVIELLDTVEDDVYGLCRRVRVANRARGVSRTGVYRACKATSGAWRLLGAGGADGK